MTDRDEAIGNVAALVAATCERRPTRAQLESYVAQICEYLEPYPLDIVRQAIASFGGSYTFPLVGQLDSECERLIIEKKKARRRG